MEILGEVKVVELEKKDMARAAMANGEMAESMGKEDHTPADAPDWTMPDSNVGNGCVTVMSANGTEVEPL